VERRMKLTYEHRVCVKCKTDPASERLSCHRCSLKFCVHSAGLRDDGQCLICKSETDAIRKTRSAA
jgi:hypothetical protein